MSHRFRHESEHPRLRTRERVLKAIREASVGINQSRFRVSNIATKAMVSQQDSQAIYQATGICWLSSLRSFVCHFLFHHILPAANPWTTVVTRCYWRQPGSAEHFHGKDLLILSNPIYKSWIVIGRNPRIQGLNVVTSCRDGAGGYM